MSYVEKMNGIILKLYFEKAYNKVKLSFLQQAMCMKGFSPKWYAWIQTLVLGGHAEVKVKDDVGPFLILTKAYNRVFLSR